MLINVASEFLTFDFWKRMPSNCKPTTTKNEISDRNSIVEQEFGNNWVSVFVQHLRIHHFDISELTLLLYCKVGANFNYLRPDKRESLIFPQKNYCILILGLTQRVIKSFEGAFCWTGSQGVTTYLVIHIIFCLTKAHYTRLMLIKIDQVMAHSAHQYTW